MGLRRVVWVAAGSCPVVARRAAYVEAGSASKGNGKGQDVVAKKPGAGR